MKTDPSVEPADDGYECTECGSMIHKGEDIIVALHGSIEETLTGDDPFINTFQYAGVYHEDCYLEAGDGE